MLSLSLAGIASTDFVSGTYLKVSKTSPFSKTECQVNWGSILYDILIKMHMIINILNTYCTFAKN